MQTESLVKSQIISSLEKVFADEGLDFPACNAHSMLRNEVYSFQLACRSTEKLRNVQVKVSSPLESHLSIYQVGLIPVELPLNKDWDRNVLNHTGLVPRSAGTGH